MGKQDLESVPVSIIMTRMPNITSCEQEDLLIDVANKLISKQIDALPVVNEMSIDGKTKLQVVGRLTKTNITKAFVTIASDEIH